MSSVRPWLGVRRPSIQWWTVAALVEAIVGSAKPREDGFGLLIAYSSE
jgi:hypothetical protein